MAGRGEESMIGASVQRLDVEGQQSGSPWTGPGKMAIQSQELEARKVDAGITLPGLTPACIIYYLGDLGHVV